MSVQTMSTAVLILFFSTISTAEELRFVGIGVTIEKIRGNKFRVNDLREQAPAEVAGVLAGDILTKIDGKETQRMKLDAFVRMIGNGPVNSSVILSIAARSASIPPQDITVVRKEIVIQCQMYGGLNLTYSGTETSGRLAGWIGNEFIDLLVTGQLASGNFKGELIHLQKFDRVTESSVSFRGYYRGAYLDWWANNGRVTGFQGCVE